MVCEHTLIGVLGIAGELRPGARDAVEAVADATVATTSCLPTATNHRAGMRPEDKETAVRGLVVEGGHVLAVGDAPALAHRARRIVVANLARGHVYVRSRCVGPVRHPATATRCRGPRGLDCVRRSERVAATAITRLARQSRSGTVPQEDKRVQPLRTESVTMVGFTKLVRYRDDWCPRPDAHYPYASTYLESLQRRRFVTPWFLTTSNRRATSGKSVMSSIMIVRWCTAGPVISASPVPREVGCPARLGATGQVHRAVAATTARLPAD